MVEQVSSAVDHGGVDDLAATGRAAGDQGGEHPDDEVHRPAGEVADDGHGGDRASRRAERVQRRPTPRHT
jgi:hypothetical protein